MATRKQNYGIKTVANRDRFGNVSYQEIATYYLDVQSVDRGTRPRPLTDTRMLVRRLENNTGIYTGIPDTLSAGKSGLVGFVFSSWLPKTITGGTGGAAGESSAVNQALSKFGSGSFNAAVALGESRETISMVASTARRLAAAALEIKRGQFSKAADTLSTDLTRRQAAKLRGLRPTERLANGWLSYQYGWKPLISDVHGSVEQFSKEIKVGQEVYAGVGRSPKDVRADLDAKYPPRDQAFEQLPGRNFTRPPTKPRVTIRGTVANANLRSLQEMGVLNPASIAWELLPYSFVADWFLNLGDYIGSATATAGMGNVRACVTVSSYTETWVNGILMTKETYIDRKPIPASPQFPGPSVAGLSHERLASAISLLVQRFR